ncbi:glycoside hydrolase family 32 protein [Cohnella endophytica]|uniref:beta-fructofuranosidase n=1 Tax=Cohnella endophytica TaxID=2419778 RepID=A0A494XVD7_9BACL|nr:glycoside hydrolase family 32 protein [Cohnella endophytica]RKP52906.1 glycoside hydrolase family 32 protein [Cohnella endophytica]
MSQYRPIYHFMPESNWMNDPNGPIYYQGEYHLFYQHNPDKPEWGTIHWGHAKSKDLVRWTHEPIALYPSIELGEEHCYSGCCVINDEGIPTILYTSIGPGDRNATTGAQLWVAHSLDGMRTWTKSKLNPIVPAHIHGSLRVTEWRDPNVWKEQDGWKMVLGGTSEGKGGALLYVSDNLESWTFQGHFYRSDRDEALWECPHVFRFGERYALIYSPNGPVRYYTGTIGNDNEFVPEYSGIVDHGGWEGYYAATGFVDGLGRRILWGWLPEGARGNDFPVEMNAAGILSLPRQAELKPNGKLGFRPVIELEQLRGECYHRENMLLTGEVMDTGVSGRALELQVDIEPGDNRSSFQMAVLRSADGEEQTTIRADFVTGTISIDRMRSSLFPGTHKSVIQGQLPAGSGDSIRLRIFVDHSVVEVFAGDETCLTTLVYPSRDDSIGVALSAEGSAVHVSRLLIWEMRSIW